MRIHKECFWPPSDFDEIQILYISIQIKFNALFFPQAAPRFVRVAPQSRDFPILKDTEH